MSHQPERKEKDCLNCGTIVEGCFCHRCGQENVVTHQSFTRLTKYFIYDIFHFDGKFFDTLIPIFTRPHLVAKEYTRGKRVKFLDPIRMYLFTSALFFLFFFSLAKAKSPANSNFSFLLLLLVFAIDALKRSISPAVFDYLILVLVLTGLIYLYKSMRNFYGQSRGKTLSKFLLLNFLGLFVILFAVFFSFSIFQL